MKDLRQALGIISGSKQFNFEYGDNGRTVFVIKSYHTGEELRLDLANITEDILEELQIERNNEEDYQ